MGHTAVSARQERAPRIQTGVAADRTGFGYVPATRGTPQPPPKDLPQEQGRH